MGKILDEDLIYEILSVVEEIPAGKVASYGQIARLIGWDIHFLHIADSLQNKSIEQIAPNRFFRLSASEPL